VTIDRPRAPRFDIREIPFSYYGSWLCVSPVTRQGSMEDDLHLISHQTGMHPVLALRPLTRDGSAPEAGLEIVAGASMLSWVHTSGRIDMVYESPDTIRLRGEGLGLLVEAAERALTPFSGTYFYRDPVDGAHVFTSYETGRRYRVTAIHAAMVASSGAQVLGRTGRSVTIAPDADPGSGTWEIAIEEYEAARAPYTQPSTFQQAADAAADAFTSFLDAVAPWRGDRTPAAELAAYVLWSATVRPAGFVTRPAVLMSKHWMDKVWSWDHCFNALALASGHPLLAWDQFLLPFDHQDSAGALPDSVTHSEVLYNFVKPPIHGWALSQLRNAISDLSDEQIAETYSRLERATRYWLEYRRAPDSELPHYHHGNDSGWDNATTFDDGGVVETADLAAFLVLQMRELAALAPVAGKPEDAPTWLERADRLLSAMTDQLWTGVGVDAADGRFASRSVDSGRITRNTSLLSLMPIVLGDLLPTHIHTALAERIREHLTPYGLATELPTSPHYESDGYWRGPIWAPSTVLIEDGLRRAGHTELADEISRRFRVLCETHGFAENFEALTGQGQRDRAYTWTASSYLILAAAERRARVE
jgi:glycogen debranching enzyme